MKIFVRIVFLLVCFSGAVMNGLLAAPQLVGPATVELIAEVDEVVPGETFHLAMNFKLEPHWHIYWKNPGASGLPVEVEWDLPDGFTAGEIQWPAPERFEQGGLMSYGFEDAVTLIVPVRAPEELESGRSLTIKAEAFWLICKELCLPGDAELVVELTSGETTVESARADVFAAARKRLPDADAPWKVSAVVEKKSLIFTIEQASDTQIPDTLYFYADKEGVLDPNAEQRLEFVDDSSVRLVVNLAIEQLDQPLKSFSGVLQSASGSWQLEGPVGFVVKEDEISATAMQTSGGIEGFLLDMGLVGWLLLAFAGGFILNLMPCVLPVLSLKVFSLLKHSGQSRPQALLHGGAYTVGVVVSFLLLAGVLLGLRALGEQIGWGFQLQSPQFVAALTVIFFLFALNLMGVFEIGAGLVGADANIAKRNDITGSFGMGVLAAVVGAPCMGPLVASVSGIAVQAQPVTGLLIFATMGLGLASPFLFLSIFPKLIDYLPKPGVWMESVKQFMGFLLMAAVVFLLFVAGGLGGAKGIISLLVSILLVSLAAWVFGRWSVPVKPKHTQRIAQMISLLLLLTGFWYATSKMKQAHQGLTVETVVAGEGEWAEWSADRVEATLAKGQPVFVDFTASWCLICQVNKKIALRTEATSSLFEDYGVVPLQADWTRYDPAITQELERFGRSGVPLYVLYTPDGKVEVLPQNLTNGKIREVIEKRLN